jgi:hypothetical protein
MVFHTSPKKIVNAEEIDGVDDGAHLEPRFPLLVDSNRIIASALGRKLPAVNSRSRPDADIEHQNQSRGWSTLQGLRKYG